MSFFSLVVLSLATWRISSLLVREDGPWSILRRIRRHFRAGEFGGVTFDPSGMDAAEAMYFQANLHIPQGVIGGILSCVWCCSVWVATLLVIATVLLPLSLYVWLIFAVSAAAIALNEALDGIQQH